MSLWDHIYSSTHLAAREPWMKDWERQGLGIKGGLYDEFVAGTTSAPDSPLIFGSTAHAAEVTLGSIVAEADRAASVLRNWA